MSERLPFPPGSDEWFRVALVTANRRKWRQLIGTAGVATTCSLVLALGPLSHPSAAQRIDVVTPPTPSYGPFVDAIGTPAPASTSGPASGVPSPARRRAGTRTPTGPDRRVTDPFGKVRRDYYAYTTTGQGCGLASGTWCLSAQPGVQTGKGAMPLVAWLCSRNLLTGSLAYETDLEMDFVVETTKGQQVVALSAFRPPRPSRHQLNSTHPLSCYSWKVEWSGRRADGTRVPGAYVLRVIPGTTNASVVSPRVSTQRFDLR